MSAVTAPMQALSFFQGEQGQSLFRGVVELRAPSLLMRSESSLDVLQVASTHQLQDSVTRHLPEVAIEYFDLNRTGIAGCLYSAAKATQFDNSIAHHSSPHQHVWCRYQPVANMETEYMSGGRGDLGVEIWVPPDMVDVNDYSNLVLAELPGKTISFGKGDNH